MSKHQYFIDACIAEASLSKAEKRKVGAVIVRNNQIIGKGHNYASDNGPCEVNGNTRKEVIHAEIAAIENVKRNYPGFPDNCSIYVSHQPCIDCSIAITKVGISNVDVHVANDFLKFDSDKLRYDLIPPEASKALAKVLTYGAKKYKPNNWKQCNDTNRYIAALMRHLEAHRSGELFDDESSLLHMEHVIANAVFIVYFLTNGESKDGKN